MKNISDKQKELIFKCKSYGITIFLVVAASLTFYFLIDKPDNIIGAVTNVFSILSPVITGIVFAFILNPIMMFYRKYFDKWFCKKTKNKSRSLKISKYLSIILSILTALAIIISIIMLLIPNLIKSITELSYDLPAKFQAGLVWLDAQIPDSVMTIAQDKITAYFNNWVSKDLLGTIDVAAGYFATGMISVFNFFFDFIIGLVVAFYTLSEKEYFKKITNKILCVFFKKNTVLDIVNIARDSNKLFTNFIGGKLLGSMIMGIMCFIGMTIFRMPYALLISSIIAVTNLIPYFGPFLGTIPCAILLLLDKPIIAIYFVILITVLQQIDCNIIEPRILKESLGISSFWIIFSIMLFGGLYGIFGMFFGAPIFAIIYRIISLFLKRKLISKDLPEDDEAYKKIENIYPNK